MDKHHWNSIYSKKAENELSWYEPIPAVSLSLIYEHSPAKNASIIDVGGGESHLVDVLLDEGFTNLTVLDISAAALEKAKARLGDRANAVKWIEADITMFQPQEKYDFWHDRATFHFLTDINDISRYTKLAASALCNEGTLVVSTFADDGPQKCSGLPVAQYSRAALSIAFHGSFTKNKCFGHEHFTPGGSLQKFTYCSFQKKAA